MWCHMLALPPERIGFSQLGVPLFGTAFLSQAFSSSSFYKLSSLAKPGSGALLNSDLEKVLDKFHR